MKHKSVKRKKICFVSSSGGHLEQILMLSPLIEKYDIVILTEFAGYTEDISGHKFYTLHQVNRKRFDMPFRMIVNSFISLKVLLTERPDFVISTGALATIPMCLLAKLAGKKLIYIESFANIISPSKTGTFLYHFADRFYIQWESMRQFYPDAICLGGIY